MERRKILISYNFQIFNVLFSLLQTLRGASFIPLDPSVAFFLLAFWNTLKFIISKNYKLWIVYLTALFLIVFIFSECLKVFAITRNIVSPECSHYLIFSVVLFSITTLLPLIFILFYFIIRDKSKHTLGNSQMILYITAFIYLDSFFIRAFKDEISFFIAILITFSIIFKYINKSRFDPILITTMLFLSINLLVDFFTIYKPAVLNDKINGISIAEYILIELVSLIILWKYKR